MRKPERFQKEREGCVMDEQGLWELFCETGRPEIWLALAGEREERSRQREELAKTAFQPRTGQA